MKEPTIFLLSFPVISDPRPKVASGLWSGAVVQSGRTNRCSINLFLRSHIPQWTREQGQLEDPTTHKAVWSAMINYIDQREHIQRVGTHISSKITIILDYQGLRPSITGLLFIYSDLRTGAITTRRPKILSNPLSDLLRPASRTTPVVGSHEQLTRKSRRGCKDHDVSRRSAYEALEH